MRFHVNVSRTHYGVAEIEADSAEEAADRWDELPDEAFDWTTEADYELVSVEDPQTLEVLIP